MLVLTRKVGQEIHIGENIVIKVLGNQHGRVRLGIAAPGEVSIRREELAPLPSRWTTDSDAPLMRRADKPRSGCDTPLVATVPCEAGY